MLPKNKVVQKERNKLMQYWWLIALSILTGVAGQTTIKIGVQQPTLTGGQLQLGTLLQAVVTSPLILFGLILYGVGALAWIAVLSRLPLSYAYPFLALNFVLVTLASRFVLGETVSPMRWLSIVLICIGIALVTRTAG